MGMIDGIDKAVGVVDKIAELFKKNGFVIVFVSIMVFGLAVGGIVTYKVMTMDRRFNEILVENHEKEVDSEYSEHTMNFELRKKTQTEIYGVLDNLLIELNADRVYIVEMHNGNNNPSGLPFIYGEMTYEKSRYGVEDVDDDYSSLTLSRYQLPIYLYEERYFMGGVEDMEKIDSKFARRMESCGATYTIIMAISGAYGDIGAFGITYCNGHEPADVATINRNLSLASQKLNHLLDRKKHGSEN